MLGWEPGTVKQIQGGTGRHRREDEGGGKYKILVSGTSYFSHRGPLSSCHARPGSCGFPWSFPNRLAATGGHCPDCGRFCPNFGHTGASSFAVSETQAAANRFFWPAA